MLGKAHDCFNSHIKKNKLICQNKARYKGERTPWNKHEKDDKKKIKKIVFSPIYEVLKHNSSVIQFKSPTVCHGALFFLVIINI